MSHALSPSVVHAAEQSSSRASLVLTWVCQLAVASILGQTLFFKFTYAPETAFIFEKLGGRPAATLVGIVELVCVILLLMPRKAIFGAILAGLTISGAIFTHLTSLGIAIVNPATSESDGGLLFGLAVTVAVGSLIIVYLRKSELFGLYRSFTAR